ncbi:MAG: alpha/beta hydrolase [Acidimicrobiia bacterium]
MIDHSMATAPIEAREGRRTSLTLPAAGDETVRCDLYPPSETVPADWGVVVAPGYGSVKDLMEDWGWSLADRGHVTCVVGYRGYGTEPDQRGRIFPQEHVEDVRAAVRWMKSEDGGRLSHVVVIGVSYGGAVALEVAAGESLVDAVVSIVGYGSGARSLQRPRDTEQWAGLLERVADDRRRRAITGASAPITLDEILMRDDEGKKWRERVEAEYPNMRFDVTVESLERLLEFAPDRHLPFSRPVPILIILAERDRMIPRSEGMIVYDKAGQPKRLVVIPEADHHDVHHGPAFERCISEIDDSLREWRRLTEREANGHGNPAGQETGGGA